MEIIEKAVRSKIDVVIEFQRTINLEIRGQIKTRCTLAYVLQGWGQVQYLYLVLVLKYIFIGT